MERSNSGVWEVPYLPIDPADLGRSYEAVIRVNSQSGKGGVAYLLQTDRGLDMPRGLQVEFSQIVQRIADTTGKEITSEAIWTSFQDEYLTPSAIEFVDHKTWPGTGGERSIEAHVRIDGRERVIRGDGTGPIDAFVEALRKDCGVDIEIRDYREHAISHGADARAAAYVETKIGGRTLFGVGLDANIVVASLRAIASAADRAARVRTEAAPVKAAV
jgi:2-isopropylmalate synthase